MNETSALERALSRDRLLVVAALVILLTLSWLYVLLGAGMGMSAFEMSSVDMAFGQASRMPMADAVGSMGDAMSRMATPMPWTSGYAVLMFFMWWIMMMAMMLPSAAPMILLHARIARKSSGSADAIGRPWATGAFTLGYLSCWAAFSVVAVSLQWSFERSGVLSPMMLNSTSAAFAGTLLIFAGLYQLTPFKQACLRHCRGPISFLSQHWRGGTGGAFAMGLHHGAFCLGCCWGLMALLFFGGIMNLYWIIGLAVIVLLEKVLPSGPRVSQVTGGLLLAWGVIFVLTAL